ncbi:MAG: glutathione S-transferase family protein [Sandaracinaceae bacterium]
MGLLVEGTWKDRWYDTSSTGGRFVRQDAKFRRWIEDRSDAELPPEAGRYHLYVAYACPWAHRTLIVRALKGLEDKIGVSVVHAEMLENGWEFRDGFPDHLYGKRFLHEIYTKAKSDFTGRVTVPVLWDKKTETVVNNESSEIIRMFNEAFGGDGPDLWPEELREEIEAINGPVYDHVNNGVYKSGFATTQEAYEEAVTALFDHLDWLEGHLEGKTWLVGDRITEADIRLFTTLVRFDPVYHFHFKCTRRRLRDYPNLWAHTRRIYAMPEVRSTVKMDAIRHHYFYSHESINPHRIVPLMPDMELETAPR